MDETLVPIALFLSLMALGLAIILRPYFQRRALYGVLRLAVERGQALDPSTIGEALAQERRLGKVSKTTLKIWSVILVALGLGFAAMRLLEGAAAQEFGPALAIAILGGGLWVAALVVEADARDDTTTT